MNTFVKSHRNIILGLGMIWLVFGSMDIAKSLFIGGHFPGWSSVLFNIYVYAPWWVFSVLAGWATVSSAGGTWKTFLFRHTALGVAFGLIHVALLTAAYWIFWPASVQNVGFGFVFGEQFFQWFHFEILVYGACVLFWQVWLRRGPTPVGDSSQRRIGLNTDQGQVLVNARDIEWLRADDNYVIVHTPPDEYRVRTTLRSLVRELNSEQFLQTHRSAVINIQRATKIEQARVELRSGARAPLSRRRRGKLLSSLKAQSLGA